MIDISCFAIPSDIWRSRVLIVVGPMGAGKSTLVRKLCEIDQTFQLLTTITTRLRRDTDPSENMNFVSNDDFHLQTQNGYLFYRNTSPKRSYAYSKAEFEKFLNIGKHVILVFHSMGGIALKQQVSHIPTIFLTASLDVRVERCQSTNDRGLVTSTQNGQSARRWSTRAYHLCQPRYRAGFPYRVSSLRYRRRCPLGKDKT